MKTKGKLKIMKTFKTAIIIFLYIFQLKCMAQTFTPPVGNPNLTDFTPRRIPAITAGKYYIRTTLTNRFLDVYDANPAATTLVQIYDFNGSSAQVWELIPSEEADYFYLKSELGKYLDVKGGNTASETDVWMWDFNGGAAQKWRFIPSIIPLKYNIQSKLGTYLDVSGGRTNNGTKVWMYNNTGFSPQFWEMNVTPIQNEINYSRWKPILNAFASLSLVHINNFTPNINQFDRSHVNQFFRPNDIKFRIGPAGLSSIETFNILPVRVGPFTIYFKDVNANSFTIDATSGKLFCQINFESNGTEIFANCINTVGCSDPSFHVDNLSFVLELEPFTVNGKVRYKNAKAKLDANFSHEGFNAIFSVLAPLANELRGKIFDVLNIQITNYFNSSAIMTSITDKLYQGIVDQRAILGITTTTPYFESFYIDAERNLRFRLRN